MKLKLKNGAYLEGRYRIKTWDAEKVKCYADTKKHAPLSISEEILNKIMLSANYGLDVISRQLGGDDTYPMEIDSASIGTGTTAPAASDTALETPTLSGIVVADVAYGIGEVTLTFFITDAQLANGTYTEFGIFQNLRLFARSLILPVFTKASNQNVTVDYTISLSA